VLTVSSWLLSVSTHLLSLGFYSLTIDRWRVLLNPRPPTVDG